jgi:hypothetical protein
MGRLDNIIARNRKAMRPKERTLVMMGLGVVLLILLGLWVFTDLGLPPSSQPLPVPHEKPVRDHDRVDGVILGH